MIRGTLKRIKNTKKRSHLEADNYLTTYVTCDDGTESGLMLTEREFRICTERFWKNKEDHPEIKAKRGFWKNLFDIKIKTK